MSRPAIMRGLQNCGGRGNSYAKLVEAEPEPVARATPPYDYLEHTEEGKQEKYHHGLCTSHGGAKARLAPGSFYPSTDRDRENGQITRQLGDSLYSAFILIWMNKSSNSNWHTLWFAVKTGLVVSLLASHYAQLSFAYYLINSIRQSHDSGYCAGDDYTPVLKMLAVISFLSLCFGDLQATYDMHLWLSMFKTSKTHEKLEVHRWVDTSNKLVKDTKIYLPLTGITWFARFVFYTLVVIPKVVVAVCVATAGSGLVLRSETDYDLVLNAVAAGFVLDLDEVVYRVFLTCAPASQPWPRRRRRRRHCALCGAVSCIPPLSAERPVRRAPAAISTRTWPNALRSASRSSRYRATSTGTSPPPTTPCTSRPWPFCSSPWRHTPSGADRAHNITCATRASCVSLVVCARRRMRNATRRETSPAPPHSSSTSLSPLTSYPPFEMMSRVFPPHQESAPSKSR